MSWSHQAQDDAPSLEGKLKEPPQPTEAGEDKDGDASVEEGEVEATEAEEEIDYESQPSSGPQKSVEGWVIIITGLHEESDTEGIEDAFSEYGPCRKISLGQDRRTGLVKGYALMEFGKYEEAQDAINALHGKMLMGKRINVDWAFVKPVGAARRAASSSSSRRR